MSGPSDDERLAGRLTAVGVLGFVLFVPPMLSIFEPNGTVLGVPVIWAYLFLVWAVVIGSVALLIRRSG